MRSAVRFRHKILVKFSLGLVIILIAMITATYTVVDFIAKDYLINKNKELINETGAHIVSEVSRQISIAETLTRTLAATAQSLPKDPSIMLSVIPQILNIQGGQDIIAGGGIWPEPQQFTPGVERRSFFWGRDVRDELQYFDQYNQPGGTGYHQEEWYVPARYSEPGTCIWSKSYMDPFTLEPMVTCTVAMFELNKFTGNATVDIRLKNLKHILRDGSSKLGGYAYAVDRNNNFLSFPDDNLTKIISKENPLIEEYIGVTELANNNASFKPVADVLISINLALANLATENNPKMAAEIARQSNQISVSEATLITANMLVLQKSMQYPYDNITSINSPRDLLLNEPVIVSIFLIPETMWKIIVVTPQRLVIDSAEKISDQILLLIITIMLIVTGIGFIYFRRNLIAPMYQMVNQLQVPVAGDTPASILDESRGDEFGLLAYHFNRATLALNKNNFDLKLQIKERQLAEQQLKHLALHDPLTNLPNRLLFQDRLLQAIALAKRNNRKFAVFFMDLDNFKIINDTQGHEVGDELLKQVALRISTADRKTDTVARLGGDEFAFIINNIENIEGALVFAQRLNKLFLTPMTINNQDITIGTSIGITIYPDDATNSEELLRNADIAMYQAKEDGRNITRFFVNEMNLKLQQNKQIQSDLAESLTRDDFELYYQPLFHIDSNKLVGAEALIRWHHPDKGMIPPDKFIPVAEQSGLINELGDWVLSQACRQIKAFTQAGIPPMRVAVNISPVQFRRKNFLQQTLLILERHGVSSAHVELEITEGAVMDNVDKAIVTMQALHDAGFKLSIDDFGTGYSSLSYLKRFPIQKVKIDRCFITDLENDADSKAIATAIIQMGHSLGLQVLAEGVENSAQLEYLQQAQCDFVQGYFTGRPMPAAQFIDTFSDRESV